MYNIVTDNILIVIYLLVWIATLIWYHYKVRKFDAGSVCILTYVIYAIFSIFTLNDPLTIENYEYKHLTIFPFIFLYLMLMLALSPAIQLHRTTITEIINPRTRTLKVIAFIAILTALCQIPEIISNFGSGIIKLIMDTDAGKDAYSEQLENAGEAGSAISNIPSIIFNSITDITFFLFFYFLTLKKKSKTLISLMAVAVAVCILQPIIAGQRGPVMASVLTLITGYMIFHQFMSKRIVRIVKISGISMIILIAIPIVAITLSRFGDRAEAGLSTYMNWYIGQENLYFNNYALDNNGIRNGDRTFYLVKRAIDSSTPKNYVERRLKYSHLEIDDNLFTTFVGDFCIDIGVIPTIVLFILFNGYVLLQTRCRSNKIKLHQLFLVYFTLCICMQGGMTLFSYSDTANLKVITMAILYSYLRYHEVLLKKFPITLKQSSHATSGKNI